MLYHGHGPSLLLPEQLCGPQQLETLPAVPCLDAAGLNLSDWLSVVFNGPEKACSLTLHNLPRLRSEAALLGTADILHCVGCSWMDANMRFLTDNSNWRCDWSRHVAQVSTVIAISWQDLYQFSEA